MKTHLVRFAASFLYLALLIVIGSCSNEHLVSIAVTPPNASVTQVGQTTQFMAMGITNHAKVAPEDITSTATWTSSTPSVATITSTGLATAAGCGTTTVTAEKSGVTGTTQFTVTCSSSGGGSPILQSINLYPSSPTIPQTGQTSQFIALGAYAPASSNNVLTGLVAWASSNTSIATVNNAGLATAVSCGSTTITAEYQGILGQTQLTVSCTVAQNPVLQSLSLYPSGPTIPQLQQSIQFIALAVYSPASSNNDLTSVATWASSNTAIANFITAGKPSVVTALACGSTTITAEYQGVIGQTPLTVQCAGNQTYQSISVLPANPNVPQINQTTQFAALGILAQGGQTDITNTAKWSSSDTQVATVNATGSATAVSCGTSTISAEFQNIQGQALLTVSCAAVTSIELIVAKTGTAASTVISQPAGINCGQVCYGLFNQGTGFQLISNPAPTSWTSCDEVIENVCYFTLKPDFSGGTQKIVTANY